MEAPDKIYIRIERTYGASDGQVIAMVTPHNERQFVNDIEYIRKDWLLEILQPSPNLYKERYDPMWIEGRNFLRAQLIDKIESL